MQLQIANYNTKTLKTLHKKVSVFFLFLKRRNEVLQKKRGKSDNLGRRVKWK